MQLIRLLRLQKAHDQNRLLMRFVIMPLLSCARAAIVMFQTTQSWIQPFSQKSRTPTVPKEFEIGLYDPAEADLEHFWYCCSAGFLRERL